MLEEEVKLRTKQWELALKESVYSLVGAAEYRDDESGSHVMRISHYTKLISEGMGMDRTFCENIYYASPLHDIGKIGIPDRILQKAGNLRRRSGRS